MTPPPRRVWLFSARDGGTTGARSRLVVGLPKESRDVGTKRFCDLRERAHGEVFAAPFDALQVANREPDTLGELFLREALRTTQLSNSPPDPSENKVGVEPGHPVSV